MTRARNVILASTVWTALLATLLSTPAAAFPTCTMWLIQSDGSYWQRCVNDDSSEHCFKATNDSGTHKTEIVCTQSD